MLRGKEDQGNKKQQNTPRILNCINHIKKQVYMVVSQHFSWWGLPDPFFRSVQNNVGQEYEIVIARPLLNNLEMVRQLLPQS